MQLFQNQSMTQRAWLVNFGWLISRINSPIEGRPQWTALNVCIEVEFPSGISTEQVPLHLALSGQAG
jgi:hypothetical protein